MDGVGAVILAAGSSRRMNGINKIFMPVEGRPLISWTVDAFERSPHVDRISLVFSDETIENGRKLVEHEQWKKVRAVTKGYGRRQDSAREGLIALGECEIVLIHDGARACVTDDIIGRAVDAARRHGAAAAAVRVTDTIKDVGDDGIVTRTHDRNRLWAMQTPQAFRYEIITEAHSKIKDDVTDDTSMVEMLGHKVAVFEGSYSNIKITTPDDIERVSNAIRSLRGTR